MRKVGIVGCGNIAKTHAWALSQMEGITIAAFVDPKLDRAEKFASEFSVGAECFPDMDTMIDKVRPDVVHICTPHYLHVPLAVSALRAGVSVFCEKPPAIGMQQFKELTDAAACGSARIGFCFQNRYNKAVLKTDELIAEERLGKLMGARGFVTWRRDEDYYRTDWKGRLDTEGGGALINQSIHTLDLILHYLGEPDTVEASLCNHHLKGKVEVEDTVEAWLSFPKDRRACFYASNGYVSDAPVILELQCERGSITVIDKCITIRENGGPVTNIEVEEQTGVGKSYWGNGHLDCIRDYYDKLDNGESFRCDIPGVEATMRTMMRIYDFR